MSSIRNYFLNTGDAADSLHHSMDSWFWWCWNSNSGDTGGIVSAAVPLTRACVRVFIRDNRDPSQFPNSQPTPCMAATAGEQKRTLVPR